MVIMGSKSGQLANRLFTFSHFIANALEYKYKLVNPAFNEYRMYFNSTRLNDFGNNQISVTNPMLIPFFRGCKFPLTKFFKRSLIHSVYVADDNEFDLNDVSYQNLVHNKKLIIMYGWLFRDPINIQKHAKLIRHLFEPAEQYRKSIQHCLSSSKKKGTIIIGVHIRRGDYKLWQSGKYYYNDNVYIHMMRQLEKLFNEPQKEVCFLIVSNEYINNDLLTSVNATKGPGTEIGDLYALSKCDFIIGPPSTYTMWASFHGKVPLSHIMSADDVLNIEHFKYVES